MAQPTPQTNDQFLGYLGLLRRGKKKKPGEAGYRSTDQQYIDSDSMEQMRSGRGDPQFERDPYNQLPGSPSRRM